MIKLRVKTSPDLDQEQREVLQRLGCEVNPSIVWPDGWIFAATCTQEQQQELYCLNEYLIMPEGKVLVTTLGNADCPEEIWCEKHWMLEGWAKKWGAEERLIQTTSRTGLNPLEFNPKYGYTYYPDMFIYAGWQIEFAHPDEQRAADCAHDLYALLGNLQI